MATIAHAERSHAKLAPSAGAAWTTCTRRPSFLEENKHRLPKNTSSKSSIEGTLAHEVGDSLLTGQPLPAGADKLMIAHGKAYAAFVRSLAVGAASSTMKVEAEVPLWYAPGEFGHIDNLTISTNHKGDHHVQVTDYKYGFGVVYAQNNVQMAIYAAAAIKDRLPSADDGMLVSMHIYQPRGKAAEVDGPVSTWHTTWGKLQWFIEANVEKAVQIITDPSCAHLRKFAPSDKACHFCPAKKAGICPAYNQKLLKDEGFEPILDTIVADVPLPEPEEYLTFDDETLGRLFLKAPEIIKFLTDFQDFVKARAMGGNPLPGTHLVQGNGSYFWANEDDAAKLLRGKLTIDQYAPRKLLSPSAAQEALTGFELHNKFKNRLKALIVRRDGAPVVAALTDKRKPFLTAAQEFAAVGETTLEDLF